MVAMTVRGMVQHRRIGPSCYREGTGSVAIIRLRRWKIGEARSTADGVERDSWRGNRAEMWDLALSLLDHSDAASTHHPL